MALNPLGVHLSIWMGENIPTPVSPFIAEALQSAQVTLSDEGPSGFQLTFHVGRTSILDLLDYRLLKDPLLRPFSRVILLVRFLVAPEVLIDGIITNVALSPSNDPGGTTLTLTGEDVSVMMDLEEKGRDLTARPDYAAVAEIISGYSGRYGLVPPLPPANPAALIPSNPLEEMRQMPSTMTDRAYLQYLADLYGFVFYVTAGPLPTISRVHWGPPTRLDLPQGALSVNMGPASNVDSISFQYDGMRAQKVAYVEDDEEQPAIDSPSFTRRIPLASSPATPKRKVVLPGTTRDAETQAQGQVDRAYDAVVTASGELDASRYGKLLKPRSLVGVRGVGKTYDGLYYVKSVTHRINRGSYKQSFTLNREGTGTTLPFLPT